MTENRLVKYIKDELFYWYKQERQPLEEEWRMAYDAFRAKYSSANLKRWKALEGTEWRSKVFVRLTKVKVVAAISQIEDILFQGDTLPFDIHPTPIPEGRPGFYLPQDIAKERCGRMKRVLSDTLVQAKFDRKLMLSVLEGAIYGLSWMQAPVLERVQRMMYQLQMPDSGMYVPPDIALMFGRHQPVTEFQMMPAVRNPNVWDVFWDMESGSPQSGTGIIHRVKMSPSRLLDLIDEPGYRKSIIQEVYSKFKDATTTSDQNEGPGRENLTKRKDTIETLQFWGRVPKKELDKIPKSERMEDYINFDYQKEPGKDVEIRCVIAGDKQIRPGVKNPFALNLRPFHPFVWEAIPHEVAGVGIPENMKDSQMMVNSGVRCFIDNKALSGNVLMAGNPRNLAPGTDRTIYPGKFFELAKNVQNSRDALQFFSPPDVGRGLLELVNLFERFADEESNLPKSLQGETSAAAPKTAFAFSRLMMAANKGLGKVIRNLDEGQIEPTVEALYHWEMQNNLNENIKGDYRCRATGFKGYNDKIMRAENLQNFMLFMLSNQLTQLMIKIPEMTHEIAKTRDISESFLATTEEYETKAGQFLEMMAARNAREQVNGQG